MTKPTLVVTDDSFAEHPQSLAEVRSGKTRNAADWTPRDVLVNLLRRIDRGEIAPDVVVAVLNLGNLDGEGEFSIEYAASSPDRITSLGLLSAALQEV